LSCKQPGKLTPAYAGHQKQTLDQSLFLSFKVISDTSWQAQTHNSFLSRDTISTERELVEKKM